jgi:peroxiredoxin Q/BCP
LANITIGKPIPNFLFNATSDLTQNLYDVKNKFIVLYFYPKDNTAGCTLEAEDFNTKLKQFAAQDCLVLGVSRDSLASHEKFKSKLNLKFELISDKDEQLCQLFDVIKEKNMYGKKCFGIERSTFLIGKKHILLHEWRKVKVPGHVDDVLATVKQLNT